MRCDRSISGRRSRLCVRWRLGMSLLVLCLLVVAFGERSRNAAGDLRSIAVYCVIPQHDPYSCAMWEPRLTHAQLIVTAFGVLILLATVLAIIAAGTLLARRAESGWRFMPGRDIGLALGIAVSVLGAYLTADGVAAWLQNAYLTDMTRAGDGLGQIPLIEAIVGMVLGAAVLITGLAVVVGCSLPRRERPANPSLGLAEG
jgi:hypothetical protein